MNDFFEVFSLVLLALLIVNLITSLYPSTKNKHTLIVVISVISVYICSVPIGSLLDSLRNIDSFSVENVLEDFNEDSVSDNYTDELVSILGGQVEMEIENEFAGVSSEVVLGVNGSEKLGTLEIIEITVSGVASGMEDEISGFIEEKYGITPVFRENTGQ